jgi:2-dehydropantoate 2-reductase
MGAGAVGCYFGGMLARAGAPVALIGRPRHVDAIAAAGLAMDSIHFQEHVRTDASVDAAAAQGARVVLFCVKTVHTESAARALAPHLAPDAIIVSLQNGVDNTQRIRAAAGIDALPAVVYVAAEMVAPGTVRHTGRGDLIVGALHPEARADHAVQAVVSLFTRAGVPCIRSNHVEADLWTKLVMNCAYNAISALGGQRYGVVARNPWSREVVRDAITETVAVARAAGVQLPADLVETGLRLGETMASALSSTAQDIALGRPTEIDSLNGWVARRGQELGVPTPVNRTLHALVKLLEQRTAPADRDPLVTARS